MALRLVRDEDVDIVPPAGSAIVTAEQRARYEAASRRFRDKLAHRPGRRLRKGESDVSDELRQHVAQLAATGMPAELCENLLSMIEMVPAVFVRPDQRPRLRLAPPDDQFK